MQTTTVQDSAEEVVFEKLITDQESKKEPLVMTSVQQQSCQISDTDGLGHSPPNMRSKFNKNSTGQQQTTFSDAQQQPFRAQLEHKRLSIGMIQSSKDAQRAGTANVNASRNVVRKISTSHTTCTPQRQQRNINARAFLSSQQATRRRENIKERGGGGHMRQVGFVVGDEEPVGVIRATAGVNSQYFTQSNGSTAATRIQQLAGDLLSSKMPKSSKAALSASRSRRVTPSQNLVPGKEFDPFFRASNNHEQINLFRQSQIKSETDQPFKRRIATADGTSRVRNRKFASTFYGDFNSQSMRHTPNQQMTTKMFQNLHLAQTQTLSGASSSNNRFSQSNNKNNGFGFAHGQKGLQLNQIIPQLTASLQFSKAQQNNNSISSVENSPRSSGQQNAFSSFQSKPNNLVSNGKPLINFNQWSTKGQVSELAKGQQDDYTQSFCKTFAQNRSRAKHYMHAKINLQTNDFNKNGSLVSTPSKRDAGYFTKSSAAQSPASQLLTTPSKNAQNRGKQFQSPFKPHSMQLTSQLEQFDQVQSAYKQKESAIENQRAQRIKHTSKVFKQETGIQLDRHQLQQKYDRSVRDRFDVDLQVNLLKDELYDAKIQAFMIDPKKRVQIGQEETSQIRKKMSMSIRKSRRNLAVNSSDARMPIQGDSGNALIANLFKENKTKGKSLRKQNQARNVDVFYNSKLYELAEQQEKDIVGKNTDDSRQHSAESFKSLDLYSENRDSDASDDNVRELANNKARFMKSIEKSVVDNLGLRGYNKAQSDFAELSYEYHIDDRNQQQDIDEAKNKKKFKKKLQKGRTLVLSQMMLNKINQDDTNEVQKAIDDQNKEDETLVTELKKQATMRTKPVTLYIDSDGNKQEKANEIDTALDHAQKNAQMMLKKLATRHKIPDLSEPTIGSLVQNRRPKKQKTVRRDKSLEVDKSKDDLKMTSVERDLPSVSENEKDNEASSEANDGRVFQLTKTNVDQDSEKVKETSLTESSESEEDQSEQETKAVTNYRSPRQDNLQGKKETLQVKVEGVLDISAFRRHSKVLQKVSSTLNTMMFQEVVNKLNQGEQLGLSGETAFLYSQECIAYKDIVLPIIQKVIKKSLVLQNYTLREGHIQGLVACINKVNKPVINTLLLENNQINDNQFSTIIDALFQQKQCHDLVYKQNTLLEQSLNSIVNILSLPLPNHLIELRLVDCHSSSTIMKKLVKHMSSNTNHLRTLHLVQMRIDFDLTDLAKYVSESETLTELNISGNMCLPLHFPPLLKALAQNRMIQILDMSWNNLIDQSCFYDKHQQVELPSMSLPQLIDSDQGPKFLAEDSTQQFTIAQLPQLVTECIGNLIRKNNCIQSINLECTGMNQYVLANIITYLRHAKSLLCFHVAQNPGINPRIKDYWVERLRIAPKVEPFIFDIKRDRDDLKRPLSLTEKCRMTFQEQKIREYKATNYQIWLQDEAASITKAKHKTRLLNKKNIKMTSTYKGDLSIQRILGHKKFQPGVGQWQWIKKHDEESCWYCGHHKFSCIMWNEEIGIYNANNNVNIEANEKIRVVEMIRKNDPNYMDNPDVPMLFSNITNWKGVPFVSFVDFMDKLIGHPDYSHQVLEMAKEQFQCTAINQLAHQDRVKAQNFMNQKTAELTYKYQQDVLDEDSNVFSKKFLRYGKILHINQQHMKDPRNTFVLPIFIKPGRAHFMLRTPQDVKVLERVKGGNSVRLLPYQKQEDAHFKFYYNRHIVAPREERVPACKQNYYNHRTFLQLQSVKLPIIVKKHLNISQVQPAGFLRERSVFADFVVDTPEMINQYLESDFDYWKIERLVRDQDQLDLVKNLVRANFARLKEVRVGAIAQSGSPPQLTQRGFAELCKLAKFQDKKLNQGIMGTLFKAVNYDPTNSAFNATSELVRYEFLEILVRIANVKYVQGGDLCENSIARAFNRFINEYILPISTYNLLPTWQPFREDELWNISVNDLLKDNMSSIRGVYQSILAKKHLKAVHCHEKVISTQMISIDQVINFFTIFQIGRVLPKSKKERYLSTNTMITDKMLIKSFYLSKMTVVDENRDGMLQYTHLVFVEFLEFIGRVAYYYFEHSSSHFEFTQAHKMQIILQWMFKPGGYKLVVPKDHVEDEANSDSDDDY